MRDKFTYKAIAKWLLVAYLLILAGTPARIYGEDRGIAGGYVNDPVITVPANSYTTFSTIYGGKRYYLGVDTTAAKSGKDTIAVYDAPCYAAMWIAGPMWSPTGALLPNKDYTRTVKSVWLAEREDGYTHKCFLSVGPDKKNYSPLVMTDTLLATMWHTAKDMTVQSQYMHGFTFSYSNETGVDVYRYLAYDPVYGFSRLYEARPSVSQRISVWDRTTGDDLTSTMTPPDREKLGLNTTDDTVKIPVYTRVYYYTNVDRFRSRFDQMDIYTKTPTKVDDQAALVDPEGEYKLAGYFEWASNPRGEGAYNGRSYMKHYTYTRQTCSTIDHDENPETPDTTICYPDLESLGWRDSTVLWVSDTKNTLDRAANVWRDTIFAIGKSPFDILRKRGEGAPAAGDYADHTDWLRQHLFINGKHYVDSIQITRRTFHSAPFTNLNMSASPEDYVFPYTHDDELKDGTSIKDGSGNYISGNIDYTFTISARYRTGNDILYADNSVASSTSGEERTLNIATRPCFRDTIWAPEIGPGGDTTGWVVDDVILYDTLLVNAYLADGTTSAIGSDPSQWVESVELVGRNRIHVTVKQSAENVLINRIAQIRYTYRYYHSSAEGDWSQASRVIWISQKSFTDDDAELYAFHHKDADESGVQGVHERVDVLYAIPGSELQLPVHRDYWGYYRWFVYKKGDNFNKDLLHGGNWSFVNYPKNHLADNNKNGFMPINHTTDGSSRGRWDIKKDVDGIGNTLFATDHFTVGRRTAVPSVFYPESNSKRDTVACDVSAYFDVQTAPSGGGTPLIGQNLSSLTEPTLSYRQVFDIRPAKEQADAMANCRVNGGEGHNGWMESHYVLAPAGRAFTLQQQYPITDESEIIEEDNLQYIYYFNPTGADDANMGVKHADSLDTHAGCYGRIGKVSQTGTTRRTLKLLTHDDLGGLTTPHRVMMVNARKGSGYVLGNADGTEENATDGIGGATTVEALKTYLEDNYLNGEVQNDYIVNLSISGSNFTITHTDEKGATRTMAAYYNSLFESQHSSGNIVRWIGSGSISGTRTFSFYTIGNSPNANRISGADNAMVRIYADYWVVVYHHNGYLNGCDYKNNKYSANVHVPDNNAVEGDEANQYWLFFEVIEPDAVDHEEHPVWEKYDGSTWVKVAEKGTYGDDYRMLYDGSLYIGEGVHGTPGEESYYRLRTEHFNLASFTVWNTNPTTDGPSNTTILSEDSIQNHYEILYTLGNELFPAPNTRDEKAFYHHMPWSFSELAYHYPTTGDGAIDASRRTNADFLPARGEYAYINKFVDPTNASNVVSSMAGAEHGYMMCINVPQKPITIFDFEYPGMPCSDQNIFLTVNLCNPVNNAYRPQITADLEGWDGSTWTTIYRYKTGEIPYDRSHPWYQLVLPINQTYLIGYQKFRCVGTMPGSLQDNSYVLIDRMRFIAKERPVHIFQNKASCLEKDGSGEVDIIARLDYQNAPYPAGTHFAYQYQKKDGDTFVPLQTAAEGETVHPVKYANDLGSFQMQDVNNNSCGVITMPLPTYIPTEPGDTIVLPGGITTHLKTYVNEGSDEHAYYVMYISEPVYAQVGDTFRVAMTTISGSSDKPDFADAGCAMERLIPIHNPIQLHVNGDATEWPENSTRGDTVVAANETYTVTATIGDDFLPSGRLGASGKCMFDVVRTMADDRGYGADEWFRKRFGCSRALFRDIMTIFRADDDRNPMRLETNWNNVRPEMFQYSGRTKQQADSMYTILNRLIVDSAFIEIGKSSYDIYLGENNNAYVVFWPIPASGQYEDATTRDIKPVSVCSTPRWFEIHSAETSTASLRLGYDNMFEGDYYILPVVRASSKDANSSLKVRIADITHSEHAGVVIGWDSTYVVDSNDPEWNPGTKTFRYHQDRIVQDDIFDNYYKVPSSESTDEHRYITFTPVNEAYIAQLQATDCKCYDYNASRTTWNVSGEGETNVLIKQSDTGCNKWGVKYIEKGGATHTSGIAEHALPGFQTPNNMELKAGYWYKFRTAFFDVSATIYHDDGGDGTCRGHAEFVVVIAPDTVRWTPSHPEQTNYWNDDNNWTPIMANKPADGFKARVPMNGTKVIIPQAEEGQLPVVSEFVANDQDLRDFGYQKNTCEKILFKPNAQMLGQEKLNYTNAFVDVHFKTGEWQTFSPALEDIYAGDMYIPFSGSYNPNIPSTGASVDTVDFETKPFPYAGNYAGNYNPREYPFAFYQGFYNASVPVPFYNTDTNDSTLSYKDSIQSKSTVDWVNTPSLGMHYAPGAPCIIMGYDATDEDGNDIVVRLPKTETQYYGYGRVAENRYISGMVENLPSRSTHQNLAYDKYASATIGTNGLSYTLRNATPADLFFFGNPTMALVDVYKLCVDNDSVLKHEEGKYYFTAYQLMNGSNYTAKTITGPGQYFIAPQRAIGLIAKKERSSLPITLKPSALVAITGDGLIVNSPEIVTPSSAPKRIARTKSVYEEPEKRWLYVTASNETDDGLKKAYLTLGEQSGANRGYTFGEDALNIASGLNYDANDLFVTPLTMYTIADNQALMQDVRDTLVSVPLIFTTLEDYTYSDYTILSFSMNGAWDKPLYLYDALTNDSILIRNGLQVAIQMPNSDQIRYFINGTPKAGNNDNQQGVTTDIESVSPQDGLYSNSESGLTSIYDMLGRRIMTLTEYDLISTIQLPTGVYVIQRGNQTERMVIR